MAPPLQVQFAPLAAQLSSTVVVLAGEELALGPTAKGMDERAKGALSKAAKAAAFTGKARAAIEVLAPAGIDAQRVILAGMGRAPDELDRLRLGGFAFAQIKARKTPAASLIAEAADLGHISPEVFAADLAFGAVLRSYAFDKYRTRKSEDESEENGRDGLPKLTVHCAKPEAAAKAFAARKALADGILSGARPRQRAGQRTWPR